MRRIPTRDTKPELALRLALDALGLAYEIHARPLDGLRREADVLLRAARVAVFVDGCYWHGCFDHRRYPLSNLGWWAAKIARTRMRDFDTDRRLRLAGWAAVRVWEHEDAGEAAARVALVVASRP